MSRNSGPAANPARRLRIRRVDEARSISDLRALARRRLPNFMFEYLEGGADGELTLGRNMAALNDWLWLPKMAIDVTTTDVTRSLFGTTLAMPLIIAPTGFNGMLWRNGDLELGEAAAEAGIAMAQSTVSMNRIEEVAALPGLRHWFQLYAYGGPRVVDRLVGRALDAGSEALIVTIDGAVAGNRLWDQRNYAAPRQLNLASKIESLCHPRWLRSVLLPDGPPNFVNLVEFVDAPDPGVFETARWIAANRPILTWDEIARIRGMWPRKLILKGILRSDEAERAVDLGADAIVLSNHGGRQAEPTIAPIEALPWVRRSLGPDFPILIDSGFRTGAQIAAAICLGANAVLTGRATLYGLAAGGRGGVTKGLGILEAELRRAMALVGARTLADLTPDLLIRQEFVGREFSDAKAAGRDAAKNEVD